MLSEITHSTPHGWARVIEESVRERASWSARELGEALRRQLDSFVDLPPEPPGAPKAPDAPAAEVSAGSRATLADLMGQREVPLALLEETKSFAKLNYGHPESSLPPEVSLVLYFAAIASAEANCRARISRLDDAALRAGYHWALGQTWLDPRLSDLFSRAQTRLSQPGNC